MAKRRKELRANLHARDLLKVRQRLARNEKRMKTTEARASSNMGEEGESATKSKLKPTLKERRLRQAERRIETAAELQDVNLGAISDEDELLETRTRLSMSPKQKKRARKLAKILGARIKDTSQTLELY